MSIDVMIIPGRRLSLAPNALFAELGRVQGSRADALVGASPALAMLGSGAVVAGDAALAPRKTYAFRLAADNTLMLSIALVTDFDEREYVEDQGSDLSPTERDAIIARWRQAGPGLTLSSGGARSGRAGGARCARAGLSARRIGLDQHRERRLCRSAPRHLHASAARRRPVSAGEGLGSIGGRIGAAVAPAAAHREHRARLQVQFTRSLLRAPVVSPMVRRQRHGVPCGEWSPLLH